MGPYQIIANEASQVIIAAAGLPTLTSGMNFYTVVQGLYEQFTESVKNGEIVLPCCVLDMGTFTPDTDFGIGDVLCKRLPFAVHYIAQIGQPNATQDGVSSVAFDIGIAFDAPTVPFTTFLVIEPHTVSSNADSPVNASIVANSELKIVSASVSWTPGFQTQLETATAI